MNGKNKERPGINRGETGWPACGRNAIRRRGQRGNTGENNADKADGSVELRERRPAAFEEERETERERGAKERMYRGDR